MIEGYTPSELSIVRSYSATLTESSIERNRARDTFTSIEKGNLGFTPYEMQSKEAINAFKEILTDPAIADTVRSQMNEPLEERSRLVVFIEQYATEEDPDTKKIGVSTLTVGQREEPIDVELTRANLLHEMKEAQKRCLDVALCGNPDVLAIDTILLNVAADLNTEGTDVQHCLELTSFASCGWGYYPVIIVLTLHEVHRNARSLGFIGGAHPTDDGSWSIDTFSMKDLPCAEL